MLENHLIIIPDISSLNTICDFVNQTATVLSQKNKIILFYPFQQTHYLKKSFSKYKKNIYIFIPFKLFPFTRFRLINQLNVVTNTILLNSWANNKFKNHSKIIWSFFPHTSNLIKFFNKSQSLYDIVDFFTAPNPQQNQKLTQKKQYLLKKSKTITAISQTLKQEYQKITSKNINIVPQGFHLINRNYPNNKIVQQLVKLNNIAGFIGAINDRLDFDLLEKVTQKNPHINFVFIGPISQEINIHQKNIDQKIQQLLSKSNVFHFDSQPKEYIKSLLSCFDVCLIPYDIKQKFNLYCYPMKIFEYFAVGKPVLSTTIIELQNFPELIYLGNTEKIWTKHLNQILTHKWSEENIIYQKELSQANSWTNKIEAISKVFSQN